MFKPPVKLEEWIALNAAPVAVADGDGDDGQNDNAQPGADDGDNGRLEASGDASDDGDGSDDGDDEAAAMGTFSLFQAFMASTVFDLLQNSLVTVGYPFNAGDAVAVFTIDLDNIGNRYVLELVNETFDNMSPADISDYLTTDANGLFFMMPYAMGTNEAAPDSLIDAIEFSGSYDSGNNTITLTMSLKNDVPGVDGGTYDIILRYEISGSSDIGTVSVLSLRFGDTVSPPVVPPGVDDFNDPPLPPIEPPGESYGYQDVSFPGLAGPASYIYEEFEWGDPPVPHELFPIDVDGLDALPDAEEILLAMSEARRQFGRLELAVVNLQDLSIDNVDDLDDPAVDAISGAVNQGNAMLGDLTREMNLLSAMAKGFSDTDPELRDGVMLEGIRDGSERALETSGEAGVFSAGLNAMAAAIRDVSGGIGVGVLNQAFAGAVEAAAREAGDAARLRDGAGMEMDVYKAQRGATEKKF